MAAAPRWSVQEYLQARKDSTKTLVVGCGTTPQRVMMGKMQGYCEGVKPAGWSLPGWLRA